jgi:hypothetical protein
VVRRWSQDGSVVVQSEVTYVRPDRTETVVPAMARYDIHGDAIRSGHVFIDTAPVFRPGQ